jgi:protein-disulfide isomerase
MSIESGQTPAASSTPPAPNPAIRPAGRATSAWMVLLPALCLVATTVFWWQTRTELTAMRTQQRELLDVLDAVRGSSTIDISGDPALGAEDALVTLIEFSDYECPFCIRHFTQTMGAIDEAFIRTGRIQYVFKDFPIAQLHPEAIRAHQAARCAAEQGKFWEMHTRMFSPAGTHTAAALEARATEAGLSLAPYRDCLASNRTVADVQASIEAAVQLGANGTPSFFVGIPDPQTNRVRVVQALSGAQPFAEFEKVITAVEAQQRR